MCNEIAEKQITASCSVVRAVLPLPIAILWVSRIVKVTYPVCKRHFLKSWFAAGLSERNLFFLGLGVLSVVFLLASIGYLYRLITTEQPEPFGTFGVVTLGFTVSYWGLYFWARRNTPIKISITPKNTLTFEFTNEAFAKEFRAANHTTS